jgi:hypothetical protein
MRQRRAGNGGSRVRAEFKSELGQQCCEAVDEKLSRRYRVIGVGHGDVCALPHTIIADSL